MPSKLLIVESPAKAKSLARYLGSDFVIKASMGHIRDLPGKELAVDLEDNFKPKYSVIPAKKKTVDDLKKSAGKAEVIFLATDPDREGEAIAWHIAHLIKGKNKTIKRVMFNEITKQAVRDAVDNPGEIDLNKVDAQQARRVLDRLVGYKVSQQLWGVIAKGLSAGRVQSVALRLIVEREELIDAFVPEEYWRITAKSQVEKSDLFSVKLAKIAGEEAKINNGEVAAKILEDLEKLPASLQNIRHRTSKTKPYPPFTTSTIQQEAARRLHFPVKRTMMVAQKLYEGLELGDAGLVGLITYMRTDSTRISPVSITETREFIEAEFGKDYLCPKTRVFSKKKKNTQDAHEAIRPTYVSWTPEKVKPFLSREQHRLYELIWNRTVATQMTEAKYNGVTVDIGVGDIGGVPAGAEKGVNNSPPYTLRAVGRRLVFAGFRKLWGEGEKEENGKSGDTTTELPDLFFIDSRTKDAPKEGAAATVSEIDGEQKFTQPPARYSESMLVKTLDEEGVGRPSTYAQIISTIQDRKYVERDDKRKLAPTDLGKAVNKILVSEFNDVFNVKFTAKMEEALDSVEEGKSWTEVVGKLWTPFSKRIEEFKGKKKEIKEKTFDRTGRTCPECEKGELIERWGRFGRFISCDQYPDCKYIEKDKENGKSEPEKAGKTCPDCEGGELLIRSGRNGKFIGCSNYPKCKHTEPLPGEEGQKKPNLPDIKLPCPREGCGGDIIAKRTRRGKLFYSCTNWKEKSCKMAFWDLPIETKCPQCDYPIMTQKGKNIVCPDCKHKEPYDKEQSD